MKINFNKVVKDINGKGIKENHESKEDMTLGELCVSALYASLPEDQKLDGLKKYEFHTLASKIHGANELDLTSEEVTTIKQRIGKAFPIQIVGITYDALEGK